MPPLVQRARGPCRCLSLCAPARPSGTGHRAPGYATRIHARRGPDARAQRVLGRSCLGMGQVPDRPPGQNPARAARAANKLLCILPIAPLVSVLPRSRIPAPREEGGHGRARAAHQGAPRRRGSQTAVCISGLSLPPDLAWPRAEPHDQARRGQVGSRSVGGGRGRGRAAGNAGNAGSGPLDTRRRSPPRAARAERAGGRGTGGWSSAAESAEFAQSCQCLARSLARAAHAAHTDTRTRVHMQYSERTTPAILQSCDPTEAGTGPRAGLRSVLPHSLPSRSLMLARSVRARVLHARSSVPATRARVHSSPSPPRPPGMPPARAPHRASSAPRFGRQRGHGRGRAECRAQRAERRVRHGGTAGTADVVPHAMTCTVRRRTRFRSHSVSVQPASLRPCGLRCG